MCDDCLYYKEVLTKTRRELSELKDANHELKVLNQLTAIL